MLTDNLWGFFCILNDMTPGASEYSNAACMNKELSGGQTIEEIQG